MQNLSTIQLGHTFISSFYGPISTYYNEEFNISSCPISTYYIEDLFGLYSLRVEAIKSNGRVTCISISPLIPLDHPLRRKELEKLEDYTSVKPVTLNSVQTFFNSQLFRLYSVPPPPNVEQTKNIYFAYKNNNTLILEDDSVNFSKLISFDRCTYKSPIIIKTSIFYFKLIENLRDLNPNVFNAKFIVTYTNSTIYTRRVIQIKRFNSLIDLKSDDMDLGAVSPILMAKSPVFISLPNIEFSTSVPYHDEINSKIVELEEI